MSAAIAMDQRVGISDYLLYGIAGADPNYPPTFNTYDDPVEAQYNAMAWLIAGWSSKVLQLNLAQGPAYQTPVVLYRYQALVDIPADIGIAKYCMMLTPPRVPYPIDQADFYAWLVNFSNGVSDRPAGS